jgi:hypothetical protein
MCEDERGLYLETTCGLAQVSITSKALKRAEETANLTR